MALSIFSKIAIDSERSFFVVKDDSPRFPIYATVSTTRPAEITPESLWLCDRQAANTVSSVGVSSTQL